MSIIIIYAIAFCYVLTKNILQNHQKVSQVTPFDGTCLSCEGIARQSCAMVPRWRFLATFLRPAFPASRVQQVSDLHLKFALRPHHVWKYGRYPIYGC